LPLNRR